MKMFWKEDVCVVWIFFKKIQKFCEKKLVLEESFEILLH
jgi:hypothetical protein